MEFSYQLCKKLADVSPSHAPDLSSEELASLVQHIDFFEERGNAAMVKTLLAIHPNPLVKKVYESIFRGDKKTTIVSTSQERTESNLNEAFIEFSQYGNTKATASLKNLGANYRAQQGKSLNKAAAYGRLEMVRYLLEDVGMRPNVDKARCLTVAFHNDQRETVEYLRSHRRLTYCDLPEADENPWKLHGQNQRETLDEKQQSLASILQPVMHVACQLDGVNVQLAEKYAIFLARFFSSEAEVDHYFELQPNRSFDLAEIMQFQLPPEDTQWTQPAWKELILAEGIYAAKFLRLAPHFERRFGHPPRNLKEIENFADVRHDLTTVFGDEKTITIEEMNHFIRHETAYLEYGESVGKNEAWAKECLRKTINLRGYLKGAEALAKEKTHSALPAIFVDGETIARWFKLDKQDQSLKQFVFYSSGDPFRGLTVGKDVGNCNFVGYGKNEAEEIVFGGTAQAIAHVTDPAAELLVLGKKSPDPGAVPKLVGKVTAWLSDTKDTLVFNSWQDVGPHEQTRIGTLGKYSLLAEAFLTIAAVQALQKAPNLRQVHIGFGQYAKGIRTMGMETAQEEVHPANPNAEYRADSQPQRILAKRLPDGKIRTRFFLFDPKNKEIEPAAAVDDTGTHWIARTGHQAAISVSRRVK